MQGRLSHGRTRLWVLADQHRKPSNHYKSQVGETVDLFGYRGLRLNLMKGIRVLKATQSWSEADIQTGVESVAIDLMTYFQWPSSINDLQMPDMLPSLLLTPFAVWHFAVIQYEINFYPVPVWRRILILDIRRALSFCITHSEWWSQPKVQTDHRTTETTKQIRTLQGSDKKKWGTRDRLLNRLFSLGCNLPNITRHFTSSTLVVIISSCA